MAKNIVGNPWVFDAADQFEGWANRNEATPPVFNTVKPYIRRIFFESGGTGGDYDIRTSNGGAQISGVVTLGANEEFVLDIHGIVDGIYMETFGSDGQILVFHGVED